MKTLQDVVRFIGRKLADAAADADAFATWADELQAGIQAKQAAAREEAKKSIADQPKPVDQPKPDMFTIRTTQIGAPWNDDQVASLNAYQRAGHVHPFTSELGYILRATNRGWVLEPPDNDSLVAAWSPKMWEKYDATAPVLQIWAHAFMTNWEWNGGHRKVKLGEEPDGVVG